MGPLSSVALGDKETMNIAIGVSYPFINVLFAAQVNRAIARLFRFQPYPCGRRVFSWDNDGLWRPRRKDGKGGERKNRLPLFALNESGGGSRASTGRKLPQKRIYFAQTEGGRAD